MPACILTIYFKGTVPLRGAKYRQLFVGSHGAKMHKCCQSNWVAFTRVVECWHTSTDNWIEASAIYLRDTLFATASSIKCWLSGEWGCTWNEGAPLPWGEWGCTSSLRRVRVPLFPEDSEGAPLPWGCTWSCAHSSSTRAPSNTLTPITSSQRHPGTSSTQGNPPGLLLQNPQRPASQQ